MLGASARYSFVKTLGVGGFGTVHKCIALDTKELIAVKIVKKECAQYGKREVEILESLRQLDPHKNNLVKFNRHFLHNETFMLEFEMLDMTIDDLMESFNRPLHLSEIQLITQQMLVALNALGSRRIVHADIKPDNIMLVNHKLQPLKVKLIDFGVAHTVAELSLGIRIQVLSYRAPEVMLGLNLNEAVDTWALGCVMANMYLGTDLYAPLCEFDRVRDMVQMQGQPDDHLLDSGIYTREHFCQHDDPPGPSWKLQTECNQCRNSVIERDTCRYTSLDDIVKTRPNTTENEDTQAFLSLLKQMMEVDPEKRIIPNEALWHPSITMKDFPSESNSSPDLSSACSTTQESQRLTVQPKCSTPFVVRVSRASANKLDDSVATHYKTAACPSDEYRLEESEATVIVIAKETSNTRSDDSLSADEEPPTIAHLDVANTTCTNDGSPAAVDRTAADNENAPQGRASLDEDNSAETPTVPVCHSDGGKTRTDGSFKPLVEIKTRKKHFKRVRLLFSRLLKSGSCCRAVVAE
ncbi:hypothetical protein F2P81_025094 [Scophthalmus maximus]|uniref:Protein kinase domain-containing protein n=1 Tax=Scophthalmus maximus TaxID=52904 RepID=A0A6A4RUI8_SCOMX|nr:hypothetical protein F2P81_025094 [Scophthalmus maximus]